jgi:hypothetical protein
MQFRLRQGSARRRRGARWQLAAAALGSSLALAACGSSGGSSSSGSAGGSNQTSKQETTRLQFNQCLRQHGVSVSDQGNGIVGALRSGVPQSTLRSAMSACRQYTKAAFGNFSPGRQTQFQDAFVKYAACLRQNGIDVPDPTFSSGGGPGAFSQALQQAQQSPNFQAVNAKCERNLPSQLQGGSGPAGG